MATDRRIAMHRPIVIGPKHNLMLRRLTNAYDESSIRRHRRKFEFREF